MTIPLYTQSYGRLLITWSWLVIRYAVYSRVSSLDLYIFIFHSRWRTFINMWVHTVESSSEHYGIIYNIKMGEVFVNCDNWHLHHSSMIKLSKINMAILFAIVSLWYHLKTINFNLLTICQRFRLPLRVQPVHVDSNFQKCFL